MTLLRRSTLKDSKKSLFAILRFSTIYYDFPKFQSKKKNKLAPRSPNFHKNKFQRKSPSSHYSHESDSIENPFPFFEFERDILHLLFFTGQSMGRLGAG